MRVEVEPLKPGVAGVDQTVAKIVKAIREGAANPLVIEEARRAVRRARPGDTTSEWSELWNYVTGLQGLRYRFDPVDVEFTAGAHMALAGGDCDDFTVRCGSLLESLGYPVEVEVAGKLVGGKPLFSHVYPVALDPRSGRWSAFDPVLDKPGRFKAAPGMRLHSQVQKRYPVKVQQTFGAAQRVKLPVKTGTVMRPVQAPARTVMATRPAQVIVQTPTVVPMRAPRGSYGYSEARTYGYTPSGLGGPWDFIKSVASKAVDTVIEVSKVVDPTRQGSLARSVVSAIPGFGNTIVAAADAVASGRKMITQATGIDPMKVVQGVAKGLTAPKALAKVTQAPMLPAKAALSPALARLAPAVTAIQAKQVAPLQIVKSATPAQVIQPATPAQVIQIPSSPPMDLPPVKTGMSTGMKVGLGVGGLAVAGGLAYAFTRPSKGKGRKGSRR